MGRSSGNEGKVINETEQKRENNRKVICAYFEVHVLLLSYWLYQILVAAWAFLLLQRAGAAPQSW